MRLIVINRCPAVLEILLQFYFFNIYSNVIYYYDGKAEILKSITPVFSVTWFFRNHSNMLIWCSSKMCCLIFLWNSYILIMMFFDELKRNRHFCIIKYYIIFDILYISTTIVHCLYRWTKKLILVWTLFKIYILPLTIHCAQRNSPEVRTELS